MSLERFHPHGPQHAFPATDQIPPLTGTLRLYVDGTAGNDAASGQGGWANAWKTLGKCIASLASVLELSPPDLTVGVFARGAFGAEELRLAAALQRNSSVFFLHAIADQTQNQVGTLTAVTAATEKHGIVRLTLGGGIVLTAADIGRVLKLTDGVNIGTSMIIKVDAVNNYCWTTKYAYPAWVIGGGGVAATIHTPSMSGVTNCSLMSSGPTDHQSASRKCPLAIIGFSVSTLSAMAGKLYFHGSVVGAVTYPINVQNAAWFHNATETSVGPDGLVLLAEAGFIAGASGYFAGGINITSSTYAGVSCGSASYCYFTGYSNKMLGCYDGFLYALVANIEGVELDGQHLWFLRVISRGQVLSYTHGTEVDLDRVSWDVPAAGIPYGLVRMQGGRLHPTANVEGDNTGTGANLYGFNFDSPSEGKIIVPDGVKGKHGRLRVVNGRVTLTAATTWAASEGGGPDIYVEAGEVRFEDNFTKSAVNSETSIQNGADGQITAATNRFTSAAAVFTAAHVGRSIKVSGSINPANNAVHLISAFVDANNVTLVAGPVYVNEGPGLTWGLVGTPQPILEVARGGRVSQASGKTFNVRHPEVDPDTAVQEWNNYGYGPNGAIYEHENAEVTLGTLVEAAGAAGATGLAAKIKNGSKLVHSGGAVLLGVAPLDLGGVVGPIPWPATPVSDAAAVTPQGCMVIPNV